MSDCILRQDAINAIAKAQRECQNDEFGDSDATTWQIAGLALAKAVIGGDVPSADVVPKEDYDELSEIHTASMVNLTEVVRCKDCKEYIDHRCRRIRTLDDWRKETDYCSYGEAKDG